MSFTLFYLGWLGIGEVKSCSASKGPRRPRAGVSGGSAQAVDLTGRGLI